MTLCSEHQPSCLADLSALCVKPTLSPTPKDEIWTGMLGLRYCVRGDRWMKEWTNLCSFLRPSVPHTHKMTDAVDQVFVKSGSNDASHHHTLAISNYIDNITVNTKNGLRAMELIKTLLSVVESNRTFWVFFNIFYKSTIFQGGDKTLYNWPYFFYFSYVTCDHILKHDVALNHKCINIIMIQLHNNTDKDYFI